MLDAITSQLSPQSRPVAERSIAATSGALFGVVVACAIALASGRNAFSLDWSMLPIYSTVIPLSIAGFMVKFSQTAPRLPMLATLWFLAFFVPGMYFSEWFSAGQQIHFAGIPLPSHDFVGFRAIIVAVVSGLLFSGVRADGSLSKELAAVADETSSSKADWQKRHDEAIRRLAMVDVDLRQQRTAEERALAAFDALLAGTPIEDEWELEIEEQEARVEVEFGEVTLAA